MDADLTSGNSWIDNRTLQVTLDGLSHQEDNNDLYENLFEATNYSIAGPYVWKFTIGKDRRKDLFEIWKKIMVEDAVNRSKDKAYPAM